MLADGQMYASGPHHYLAMDEQTRRRRLRLGRRPAIVRFRPTRPISRRARRVARLDRQTYAEASRKRHDLELEIYQLSRERDPETRSRN